MDRGFNQLLHSLCVYQIIRGRVGAVQTCRNGAFTFGVLVLSRRIVPMFFFFLFFLIVL